MGWWSDTFGGGGGGPASGNSPQDSTPEYGAFSVRGLTSSDPANYARNQAAANMYADMQDDDDRQTEGGGYRISPGTSAGGGSNADKYLIPVAILPNTDPSEYTGSSEVPSLLAALSSMPGGIMPEYQGYGSVFQNMGYPAMGDSLYASQPSGLNFDNMTLMDIFSAYPQLAPPSAAPPASGSTGE
jgi:hypothetical protein